MPGPLARHWTLDPDVLFLNHGSFGACPAAVLEAQRELRAEMERQPVEFLARRLPGLLDAARERLAGFVGADPEGLVPVANATAGVNVVLRAQNLAPGDEVLVTDHAYNACRNALDFVTGAAGARVVEVRVPWPLAAPEEVTGALSAAVTPRTRLALVDHVASPTGLVLPVERIVPALAAMGVDTLVDGAHAPGMVDLDVRALDAAYYVGNCHKWLCAPKASGFVCVRADRRDLVRPSVTSHGLNTRRPGRSRLHDEFDWAGTGDPTAFLCVPRAIDAMAGLVPGGWPEIRARNRALALVARDVLACALDVPPPCPDSMVGSMAALPLPPALDRERPGLFGLEGLHAALLSAWRIEAPILLWPAPPHRLVRVSAQLYNDLEQYRELGRALGALLGDGR